MAVIFLLVFQLAVAAAAFVYLWRRQQRLADEVAQLRARLADVELRAAVAGKKTRVANAALVTTDTATAAPVSAWERAKRAWRQAPASESVRSLTIRFTPELQRGLVLGVIAAAPLLALAFGVAANLAFAAGLGAAAAMMFAALRQAWSMGAWGGVITGAGWAVLGWSLGGATSDPSGYALCVAMAGVAGLAHAALRPPLHGAMLALAMAMAALALGSQAGMIGWAGAAYFALAALAALIGATNLRLESLHLAAFGASLIGLFVLSGQTDAAIWFTPVAAMTGAIFFAIAAVRAPQLGATGAALAGVGALAPLGVIAALHDAHHGLADPFAAGAAFLALAGALGGVLAVAARRQRDWAELKLTRWMLIIGIFAAASCAVLVAFAAPLAASGLGAIALVAMALDMRWPARAWRICAILAAALALTQAWDAAFLVLNEALGWPPTPRIAFGMIAPALLLGAAALVAQRNGGRKTATALEAMTLVLGVGAANVAIRYFAADGAPLLNPIGFVEAGAHIGAWLAAALLLGARLDHGARGFRRISAAVLGALSLAACAVASFLWLTPFWASRAPSEADASLLSNLGAGFVIPAALLWGHWLVWRARRAEMHTRLALGGAAMMTAAFATYEALQVESAPGWLGPAAALASFALAIGINFASGVTAPDAASNFEENFDRDRTREQSGQLG
jgi:hypothetical protein